VQMASSQLLQLVQARASKNEAPSNTELYAVFISRACCRVIDHAVAAGVNQTSPQHLQHGHVQVDMVSNMPLCCLHGN